MEKMEHRLKFGTSDDDDPPISLSHSFDDDATFREPTELEVCFFYEESCLKKAALDFVFVIFET